MVSVQSDKLRLNAAQNRLSCFVDQLSCFLEQLNYFQNQPPPSKLVSRPVQNLTCQPEKLLSQPVQYLKSRFWIKLQISLFGWGKSDFANILFDWELVLTAIDQVEDDLTGSGNLLKPTLYHPKKPRTTLKISSSGGQHSKIMTTKKNYP